MHDHNNDEDNNHGSSMMWMMAICCLAPFIFLLVVGKGLAIQGWNWLIVPAALAMMAYHFWQMRKPHREPVGKNTNMPGPDIKSINQEQQDTHEHDHH